MKKISAMVFLLMFANAIPVLSITIDEYIEGEMKSQKIPGLSLAILRDGKIVMAKGYGMANLEHNVPAKPETVYQSGSVGKQFTATAVMLLVQEGKIKLDDPVTKYFPDSPASWKAITVRHLLTHASGLPEYWRHLDFRRDYTEEELLKVLQKLKLEFKPGEKYDYSNSGYMLLGFLIHKASGKFYGDYLQERVFHPLKMSTTRIISEADIIPNRAAGYELVDGTLKNQERIADLTTADGALCFSVLDLAKWDEALYGEHLLPRAALEQMWTPVKLSNGATYPYGFGWRVAYQRGHRIIAHSGHWLGFSTAIFRYIDDKLTVIVLCNQGDISTTSLARNIAGLYYPALVTAPFLHPVKSDRTTEVLKTALNQIVKGNGPYPWPLTDSAIKDQKEKLGNLLKEGNTFEFLDCDDVAANKNELYGLRVNRYCYYKIMTKNGPQFATFALTDQNSLADYWIDHDDDAGFGL